MYFGASAMAKPSFFSSDLVQVLLCPRLHELQFAVKALLAGGLALYLAFSLELEQPQWALMTVFVVSQPYSGMVLAKGMFRLIGTCAGALVSIGMVALYGQASLPFLLLMALWLAFCTAGASLLHNHASYGFVLAGYTAAIVALPASADPATVFDQAVARCSEIGLGILCAALVNVLRPSSLPAYSSEMPKRTRSGSSRLRNPASTRSWVSSSSAVWRWNRCPSGVSRTDWLSRSNSRPPASSSRRRTWVLTAEGLRLRWLAAARKRPKRRMAWKVRSSSISRLALMVPISCMTGADSFV